MKDKEEWIEMDIKDFANVPKNITVNDLTKKYQETKNEICLALIQILCFGKCQINLLAFKL
jgi:hypothetical protein